MADTTEHPPGQGEAPAPRRRVPVWAWIGGAVLAVVVLVGVLALAGVFGGGEYATTPEGEEATEEPTAIPTVTPSKTDQSVIQMALDGVTANNQWSPHIQESNGVSMALVPAGCFQMGSSDEEIDRALELCESIYGDCGRGFFEDEKPQHEVCFKEPFWIDVYEVTNAHFAAFLNDQGNQTEGGVTWLNARSEGVLIHQSGGRWVPLSGYDDHPVIEVTWFAAASYCEWRGARLPAEAEWEYAARGPDGLVYPWGNGFDGTLVNYCDKNCTSYDWADWGVDDGYRYSSPVGAYPDGVSWIGAFDMSGNVYEWMADWYGPYPSGRQAEPTGPCGYRVSRGGSWDDHVNVVRAAYRQGPCPDNSGIMDGFRCARSCSP